MSLDFGDGFRLALYRDAAEADKPKYGFLCFVLPKVVASAIEAVRNTDGMPRISCLFEMTKFTSDDLLRIPGIGPKRLAEIRRVLAENGLSLEGDE